MQTQRVQTACPRSAQAVGQNSGSLFTRPFRVWGAHLHGAVGRLFWHYKRRSGLARGHSRRSTKWLRSQSTP
eukprot:7754566-Alexandrium_andersonii.AAC.1